MDNAAFAITLKHLPGKHNQKDHAPKTSSARNPNANESKLSPNADETYFRAYARQRRSDFDKLPKEYEERIETARNLIRTSSPSGKQVLDDTFRWFFNGTTDELGMDNTVGKSKNGDHALRDLTDSVLAGTASKDDAKALGAIYAYTQAGYAERGISDVDIWRGVRLPKSKVKQLKEGQEIEVGSVGHWSDTRGVAEEFASTAHGGKENWEGVVLHRKNVPVADILTDYRFDATMHPDFATYENEVVPITTRPLKIVDTAREWDEASGEVFTHVWLE